MKFVINMFSFQKTYVGRGLFLIFVAILCFDYVDELSTLVGKVDLAVGIILAAYGIFLVAIGCCGDNSPFQENVAAAPAKS